MALTFRAGQNFNVFIGCLLFWLCLLHGFLEDLGGKIINFVIFPFGSLLALEVLYFLCIRKDCTVLPEFSPFCMTLSPKGSCVSQNVYALSAHLHCSRDISGVVTGRSSPQNMSDLARTLPQLPAWLLTCPTCPHHQSLP